MLFPTLDFLFFFIVVLALMVPVARAPQARKLVLVGASYFFYAQWNWHYCLLLAGSSVLTYSGGLAIGHASSQQTRKLIVGITVALHLLLLSTFKYLDFLVGSANHLLHFLGTDRELPFMEIILPVGISFFTFHGISYLVDVYRGDVAVCRRLVDILLYLSFFPQLVAGPIVTARQFVHEFLHPREADKVVISLGVNDGVSATTIPNLQRVRESVRGRTVYWLLPAQHDYARGAIRAVASRYGDRVIDCAPTAGPDGLHPTGAGYRSLGGMIRASRHTG